uniref:ubiquitinyl hydrolase 1 n=1 Tax=Sinocyclocheilus grahami TaxID=75366 RepID=A0A672M892_SINGR
MFACLFQSQMLLNQLREITGIQDLQVLQSALNVCLVQQHLSMYDEYSILSVKLNNYACLCILVSFTFSDGMKRKRCEGSGESCSPADWIRQEDCPVGIRNVGNTCWFSAVIQSLFHLPVFRRLVLNYCLSERVLEKCKSHSEKRNIAFMQELRCLFALMVGSNRRFVDPSAAVELLRDAFRTSEAQQDVSEFTHKLLDWLEDAFQLAANGNNPEDKQNNPMVQLFYGTFVAERLHEGKIVSNIEQFGQYPLQVNGFNNLDECLEGAMVEGEIESLHSDQTMSSGQERWFSKLPPVLTFELSRFEFNQSLGRPEKIHKKLEFPQVIYMDRYLHKNVDQTHGRRGDVKRLKDQLTVLQQKLEGYGQPNTPWQTCCSMWWSLPLRNPQMSQVTAGKTHFPAFLFISCVTNCAYRLFSLPCLSPSKSPMEVPLQPAPHSVTEEELYFVRSCLQRWRAEVENTVNELKASIDKVSQALEGMYSDNSLCQVSYRLHAVLVHEGQASAGHYWAYIYDHANKRWLKYNDVMVTESTWEELVRDSYGGMTNASAYCLMYISDKLPYLIAEDTDDETGQALKGMDSLPSILRRYVREDNRWFQQELREWEEQFCQAQCEEVHTEKPIPEEPQNPEQEPNPEPAQEQTNEVSGEPPTDSTPAPVQDSEGQNLFLHVEEQAISDEGGPEAEPDAQVEPEAWSTEENQVMATHSQPENEVSEVEIPNVGKILVRSDADGYNEEMMLTPAMQGVIFAIAKARQVFDKDGPEAGLIKAFHEEYSRLYELSQEETTPQQDPRLQHVLVYLFQNQAPNRVIERTLLEQFGDRNLSFDDRAVSIMREARSKIRLIKPEDMDMDEYLQWHDDYSMFKTVFAYLLTGLEQYQNGKIREALNYLAHAHQDNSVLLRKGERKGVDQSLIALYRRKCLKELNDNAATLFKSPDANDVAEAVTIMNECIIPCMHLMVRDSVSQEDLDVIELIRSCWCSYLGQDMDDSLQEKLSEFLPRVLDCSAELVVLKEPPKVRKSPHDLCSRLTAVMESIHSTSVITVK